MQFTSMFSWNEMENNTVGSCDDRKSSSLEELHPSQSHSNKPSFTDEKWDA